MHIHITCFTNPSHYPPLYGRTVSSFTSEHLQQSLQHCNESISYDESTDYGGRSSATDNGHLPHHRDRCGRWVSAHLKQERTDFQMYGLPLQMCMDSIWQFSILSSRGALRRRISRTSTLLFIALCSRDHSLRSGWQYKNTVFTCLDEHANASREILQRAKAHSWIRQGVFTKTSKTFSKSSSSFWKSPVKCLEIIGGTTLFFLFLF